MASAHPSPSLRGGHLEEPRPTRKDADRVAHIVAEIVSLGLSNHAHRPVPTRHRGQRAAAMRLCACLDVLPGHRAMRFRVGSAAVAPGRPRLSAPRVGRALRVLGSVRGVAARRQRPAGAADPGADRPITLSRIAQTTSCWSGARARRAGHGGGGDGCVRVPMAQGRRALNVVTALAIVLGEALRQTGPRSRRWATTTSLLALRELTAS